ncbi:WD-40 repeat family protein [Arabidopsis lyrata subsp. lyrata]|uniref:WD-40 repeat family protein n=1 Tax=Arabidopsis lyrata subsp. lyrata TaxID=81972 RepID=D7LKF0_ARALL|nr:WD repeat-containing protein 44 [Arabidopsis lyrata subsp. lyrata]EFH57801.1 WD-40 repeat family protein [Arabidopsis lyrata subsp. lyrata]|eukprot:XP_002881542.1 WD repeat-containing protein 44 [Arabidopsis lyrata subsp. lyrata]
MMEDGNKLDRKKTMTMNWEGLGDFEDEDDDRFFETHDRLSSALAFDMSAASSSDEDEDFDDCRLSFSSAVSSLTTASRKFRTPAMSPDYDIWMAAPGSISERRRRLLHGMGLVSNKDMVSAVSIRRVVSNAAIVTNGEDKKMKKKIMNGEVDDESEIPQDHDHVPVMLARSRSESDIERFLIEKRRKEEILGKISKQRLTRTYSTIGVTRTRICQYQTPIRQSPAVCRNGKALRGGGSDALTSVMSNARLGAFFLIKNLDTGKEFIVNEYDEDGMWNRLSDLQTGKQLTLEEFEKCVGYSPVVKELMRRENVNRINYEPLMDLRKFNSYLSKSVRLSKRRGAALLKNIKGVAHSMSLRVADKDVSDGSTDSPKKGKDHKHGKANEWVKVRPTGKSYKELSALHMCQEIQAHEGAVWTIKFSQDAHYLASGGADRVIHVWEVQECELMSMNEGSLTPIHPSLCDSAGNEITVVEKKRKGKGSSGRRNNHIPDYVHVPETVFSFSDKPVCSLKGHLDAILDLSWSKSQLLLSSSMDKTVRLWDLETKTCLKLFAHNDYVTCIQFSPVDENYFLSGSLDAKIRIWSIQDRHVVEWSDLHEMVTAACYTPDGQGALIGSHKGICRAYDTEDCKLSQTSQIDVQSNKKSQAKRKITSFQFSPVNPSEVLVTSADSRIRILDGSEVIHKFKGFRNTCSQLSASYSQDGKYIICASEDSQVYLWKNDFQRTRSTLTTQSHEHFHCKDVSAAVPWHGHVRGEPPPVQIHSKRHSKRISTSSQPSSTIGSPTREETSAAAPTTSNRNKKSGLPPMPKKAATKSQIQPEEEAGPELGSSESFRSSMNGSEQHSSRFGESPSINTSSRLSSWSWFDSGGHGPQTIQPTAWGMVIVTATVHGEIRSYQNFGLPRRIGRQTTLF